MDPFPSFSRLFDQHFGMGLTEEELMPPTLYHGYYVRPRRQLTRQLSGTSEFKAESDKFQVMLDVNQFTPEEIIVKTVDNAIIVHGKHEEKMDDHGFVSREFTRRYLLPEGTEPEQITSALSHDGILTIDAPRKQIEPPKPNERVIPIVRREAPAVKDGAEAGKSM